MFVDYVKIKVTSGKGGDGASTFRREKYVPKGGPDGGDGGRGGHVFAIGDKKINTLLDLYYKKIYHAENGGRGMGSNKHGKNGKDVFIKVPLGTVIRDASDNSFMGEILNDGEKVLLVKGGRGGRGNARFKSSTHQAPRFYEKGEPEEEKELIFELKIIADVGIIGHANAGKSTLLSHISNAHPKIADYPFTTLVPVLGIVRFLDLRDIVIADIPGLIEGASKGKGLGFEFLRHVERTRIFIHLVDPTQGDAFENYKVINKELEAYDKKLLKKSQIVVVNKIDLLSEDEIKTIKKTFEKKKIYPVFISAKENIGLEELLNKLYNVIKDVPTEIPVEKEQKNTEEKDELKLTEIDKGIYKLENKKIEKYVAMLDFNNQETLIVFRKFLERNRINRFLMDNGVKTGDIVVIGNKDFIFEE
ncbi:MAG: GTPase ObgE [Candidatus Goldbacteria bacterium]|nr:GTPase ObgE [Candidatus Goldiibacteriota bacterium]